jgi:hypothetical protein
LPETDRGPSASRTAVRAPCSTRIWTSRPGWSLGGSYTVWRESDSHLDLLAGARLLSLDTNLALSGGGPLRRDRKVSQSVDLWDGVIGARGRVALSKRWFLP